MPFTGLGTVIAISVFLGDLPICPSASKLRLLTDVGIWKSHVITDFNKLQAWCVKAVILISATISEAHFSAVPTELNMPRLSSDSQDPKRISIGPSLRARIKRAKKAILRSYKVKLLKGTDLPIRLRPWFLFFTALILTLLGLLGFTTIHVPFNDKVLHFVCMGTATGVFYWIFDVDEDARRVWFWRYSALNFTFGVCFLVGGIFSEIVQSMLPYRKFEAGDIIANILGSSCGLTVAYCLEKYYRKRREIARLYQPIDADIADAISDDELDSLTSEAHALPLYRQQSKPENVPTSRNPSRMRDVWDDREELFAVDEEDEDELEGDNIHSQPNHQH